MLWIAGTKNNIALLIFDHNTIQFDANVTIGLLSSSELSSSEFQAEADVSEDGLVDSSDIAEFIDILNAQN